MEKDINAAVQKAIDGRTKEFKEKIAKLAYEKIKAQLAPSKEPLKGFPYNEEVELQDGEILVTLDEKVRGGKGNGVADIDYIGNDKMTKALQKKFRIKIKKTGRQTADVIGKKQDIINFLQSDAMMLDDDDVVDLYPELTEAVKERNLQELNARYGLGDMKQSKDPKVKRELGKLKKTEYGSLAYIRQWKEVEAALDQARAKAKPQVKLAAGYGESVEITEDFVKDAQKEIKTMQMHDLDFDIPDYKKAIALYKQKNLKGLKKLIYGLDTEPSEDLAGMIARNDRAAFDQMYPNAKPGEYIRSIVIKHGA